MSANKRFDIVVAATLQNGIGFKGTMPWPHLKDDMKFFFTLTSKTAMEGKHNAVIMGRKTWDSLPDIAKPLKGRCNIVITRQKIDEGDGKKGTPIVDGDKKTGVFFVNSFQDSINLARSQGDVDRIFVIGGGEIYKLAMAHLDCRTIYMTNIHAKYECDTFFPSPSQYDFILGPEKTHCVMIVDSGAKIPIQWVTYVRDLINKEELQYLNLIRDVLQNGIKKKDRTKIGTLSVFGRMMKFDLRNGHIPLFTTKKTFFRGIVEELIWFLSGNTNAKVLLDKKVDIWAQNSNKETLEKLGFKVISDAKNPPDAKIELDSKGRSPREEYDCGPIYGHQWRYYGAKYINCKTDYTGQGFDQIKWLVNEIKTNPNSRRLVLNAWNPCDIDMMVLPPCHMGAVFEVTDGYLNCAMTQRSVDVGLGVVFNVCSYALLTIMLAHVCGLKPGEFTHFGCNTHIYLNHIDALTEQATRVPKVFPKLKIKPSATGKFLDEFVFEDFALIGYEHHPTVKMEMAV